VTLPCGQVHVAVASAPSGVSQISMRVPLPAPFRIAASPPVSRRLLARPRVLCPVPGSFILMLIGGAIAGRAADSLKKIRRRARNELSRRRLCQTGPLKSPASLFEQ